MQRPEAELTICRSQIRLPNHYTTEPPLYSDLETGPQRLPTLLLLLLLLLLLGFKVLKLFRFSTNRY